MTSNKHIIFDLDGTIINSKKEIIKTYKTIANTILPNKVVNFELLDFGANLNSVLNFIYDGEKSKINLAKLAFAEIYDNSDYEETEVFADVYSTLEKLKNNKYTMHIATNKRHFPTLCILDKKNLKSFFTTIIGNEKQKNVSMLKKEMISEIIKENSINNAVMIGDTAGDIEAGKANNIETIAVTYGYELEETLKKAKPSYIANSFKEIVKFV